MLMAFLLFGRWEGALPHLRYLVCNSSWTARALMGLQIISRRSYRSLEDRICRHRAGTDRQIDSLKKISK